jgi:small subunit ribosomal protein S17
VSKRRQIQVPDRSPKKVGVVQSDARDKTRKVAIQYSVKHPKYGKYVRRRTVLHVHDEDNVSHVGDTVEIAECRPVSKTKSWVLLRVLKEAAIAS